jgi:hypothetical protein
MRRINNPDGNSINPNVVRLIACLIFESVVSKENPTSGFVASVGRENAKSAIPTEIMTMPAIIRGRFLLVFIVCVWEYAINYLWHICYVAWLNILYIMTCLAIKKVVILLTLSICDI